MRGNPGRAGTVANSELADMSCREGDSPAEAAATTVGELPALYATITDMSAVLLVARLHVDLQRVVSAACHTS
jgi:hypothetical protein